MAEIAATSTWARCIRYFGEQAEQSALAKGSSARTIAANHRPAAVLQWRHHQLHQARSRSEQNTATGWTRHHWKACTEC
jgi:hypothetical protein